MLELEHFSHPVALTDVEAPEIAFRVEVTAPEEDPGTIEIIPPPPPPPLGDAAAAAAAAAATEDGSSPPPPTTMTMTAHTTSDVVTVRLSRPADLVLKVGTVGPPWNGVVEADPPLLVFRKERGDAGRIATVRLTPSTLPRDVNYLGDGGGGVGGGGGEGGEEGGGGGDEGGGGRQAFWSGGKRGTFQGRGGAPPLHQQQREGGDEDGGGGGDGDASEQAEHRVVRAGGEVRVEFTIVEDCGGLRRVKRNGRVNNNRDDDDDDEEEEDDEEDDEEEDEEAEGGGASKRFSAGCHAAAFDQPPPLTMRVEEPNIVVRPSEGISTLSVGSRRTS